MKAMILAAGRGERLRPLTNQIPKPLIPVADKPLIHHTLSYLKNCGIEEVVINLHHLGDQIQSYVGDGSRWGLRIHYSLERQLLGTGGGIQKAAPYLLQETFVVLNGDILLELDLKEVVAFHKENNADVTMVLRKDPDVDRFGAIEVDGYDRVRQILGRIPIPKAPRKRLMFTGVHVLEPEVFSHMPSDLDVFSIIDVYVAMLLDEARIMGYPMTGFWADLGTKGRYDAFLKLLADSEITMDRLLRGGSPGGEE